MSNLPSLCGGQRELPSLCGGQRERPVPKLVDAVYRDVLLGGAREVFAALLDQNDLGSSLLGRGVAYVRVIHNSSGMVAPDHRPGEFLSCECPDMETFNIGQHLPPIIKFIHKMIAKGRLVVVYCMEGVSRSATVCAVLIMALTGCTPDEAVEFLRANRPKVNPNRGFMAQLEFYKEGIYTLTPDWAASDSPPHDIFNTPMPPLPQRSLADFLLSPPAQKEPVILSDELKRLIPTKYPLARLQYYI